MKNSDETDIDNDIVQFANAVNIDTHYLLDYIKNICKNKEEYIPLLNKIKISYVDYCIINKNTKESFIEHLSELKEECDKYTEIMRLYGIESDNPLSIITHSNEQLILYTNIVESIETSKRGNGIKALHKLLQKYSLSLQ